jgi:hypothetical protein
MELKVKIEEYSIEYRCFATEYHKINARINQDGEDAAVRAMESIAKKKISPEEKENEKSMWIQKNMHIQYKHPIDNDIWSASFEALRKLVTGMTTEEAIKEAKKQTTLDQHPNDKEEES